MTKFFLGIDAASQSTGWSVIAKANGGTRLVEYGLISPNAPMSVTQRLYFFGNEIEKMIEKQKPDEIAMEETVLVRGPKIMRTLARFSGVALYKAYSFQKREIATYEPPAWKKKIGLSGHAKKADIQLFICSEFGLLDVDKVNEYGKRISENEALLKKAREELRTKLKEFEFEEKRLKREMKLDKEKKQALVQQLKELVEDKKTQKKELEKPIKICEREYDQISTDIYSDCGVNSDIADATGVALACSIDAK